MFFTMMTRENSLKSSQCCYRKAEPMMKLVRVFCKLTIRVGRVRENKAIIICHLDFSEKISNKYDRNCLRQFNSF